MKNMVRTNFLKILILTAVFLGTSLPAFAATLQVSPNTGVYSAGTTFGVRVVVNTGGKSINAAEGSIRFNPQEVSVVSIDRTSSIFNLWVTEPTFSNTAGTITFSGGLPSGYTGTAGTVFNINFRSVAAGTARVSYTSGAVLANDGKGTNVLSEMTGGTYTIQAPATQPTPEIIEYIAPANTPGAPIINSTTHPDPAKWSTQKTAELKWTIPSDVVTVRTLLDGSPTSIPTRVYETPIKTITLEDLPEGESYFHLQFKNDEGWGKVAHYRLAVDTEKPSSFTILRGEASDLSSPVQLLNLKTEEGSQASPVRRFMVKIDNDEVYEFIDEAGKGELALPVLTPGYHSVIIEAFDTAGNSAINTISFTIVAFDRPVFTEYPSEINEEVIPVIRGLTRAGASVTVELKKVGSDSVFYTIKADEAGVFTFIPEGTLTQGVYELVARATDSTGAQSEASETVRLAVQQPGYLLIGERLISVLSVIVPLFALVVLLGLSFWALFFYVRRLRRKVSVESKEALAILAREFKLLQENVQINELALTEAKKMKKLTKAEQEVFVSFNHALTEAQLRVEKEMQDVESLVTRDSSRRQKP